MPHLYTSRYTAHRHLPSGGYSGPKLWDALRLDIRSFSTLSRFKRAVTNFCVSNYVEHLCDFFFSTRCVTGPFSEVRGAVPAAVVASLLKSPRKTICRVHYNISGGRDLRNCLFCAALSRSTAMYKVISSIFHSVNGENMYKIN